jgi:hypothetical protein
VAVPGRRIPRNNGAYRLGEILAIRQSRQRIVASRGMGLTLKAGQLLVRFTESTCNTEQYQSRQNKRQRRKRHHTDDEAPSLGNKIEFTGPPQGPKDLAFQTAFPGPGHANMVSKASARTAPMRARVKGTKIPVHPACRMGHMRLPCLTRDWPPGPAAHIAQKHVSEQSIILR